MMFSKKIFSLIVLVLFLLSFSGCTLIRGKINLETKDINGEEDFSLAVFGEEEICAEKNECYCVIYGFNPSGSSSYTNEEYQHDADTVEAVAKTPLSGVSLLQMTYGKEDTIIFTVECDRSSGNMRIVLLDENFDIIHDFDVSEKSSHKIVGAKDKTFEIRVAGESAEFEIKVSREFVSQ